MSNKQNYRARLYAHKLNKLSSPENHSDYMFDQNFRKIHRQVMELEDSVTQFIDSGGKIEDWLEDKVSKIADDMDEVYSYIKDQFEQNASDGAYRDYFEGKMDKHNIDEITDLDSTEEKKDFFNEVDHGWQAEHEQDANDMLPGGLADASADEDFDPEQLAKGIKVELEHTDDIDLAKEIAKDHLKEDPKYYDKLELIEPEHAAYDEQSQGPGPDAPGGHGGYVLDRAAAAKRYERKLLK